MSNLLRVALVTWLAVVLASSPIATRAAGIASKTVWDGLYSSAQANRGQTLYDKKCASCHMPDLSGGGDEAAAVLRGADFFAQWNNKSVGDIFKTIGEGMPKDAPGSLSGSEVADVVAFLLKKNLIPAGDKELPTSAATLTEVLVTSSPK